MPQFTAGNKMWERRSTVGREMLFSSPEIMWAAACEYFEWCDANPWKDKESVTGRNSSTKIKKLRRPYTWQGLTRDLDCNIDYFSQFRKDKEKCTPAFSRVIEAIESVIYQQKFEGATIGAFNANIISRDLGLVDKQKIETELTLTNNLDLSKLDEDELRQLIALQSKSRISPQELP